MSVHLASAQDPFASSTRPMGVDSINSTLPCAIFPPRSQEPPPTLRDRLNPHLSPQRRRFPISRYAKRPYVSPMQSVHSFSFPSRPLRTAPSRFPSTMHFGTRPPLIWMRAPRPQTYFCAQRRLNALTRGYLKSTAVRGHPIVWSLALCPDDTKQDAVVYGAEVDVVLLVKGPRTSPIQEGLDCVGLYHSSLEGERYFRLIVEVT